MTDWVAIPDREGFAVNVSWCDGVVTVMVRGGKGYAGVSMPEDIFHESPFRHAADACDKAIKAIQEMT